MKLASPLGQGGTSGGFRRHSLPGVGLSIGEPTPALRDRCRFAPPLQRRGFSEGMPCLLRQRVRMNVDLLLISPLYAGAVKKLKIGSFRKEACAGAPAPPGGTRAPRAFSAVASKLYLSRSSNSIFSLLPLATGEFRELPPSWESKEHLHIQRPHFNESLAILRLQRFANG